MVRDADLPRRRRGYRGKKALRLARRRARTCARVNSVTAIHLRTLSDLGLTWIALPPRMSAMSAVACNGAPCWPRLFGRRSNLDTPVAINEEARRHRLESPYEAAIMYACLDVDVVVSGFK